MFIILQSDPVATSRTPQWMHDAVKEGLWMETEPHSPGLGFGCVILNVFGLTNGIVFAMAGGGQKLLQKTKAKIRTYGSSKPGNKEKSPKVSSPKVIKKASTRVSLPKSSSPVKSSPFKTTAVLDDSEEDEEGEDYEVEAIVDKARDDEGNWMYLVKWVGYPSWQNTWQTIDTLNCEELVQEYEASRKANSPKIGHPKSQSHKKTSGKSSSPAKSHASSPAKSPASRTITSGSVRALREKSPARAENHHNVSSPRKRSPLKIARINTTPKLPFIRDTAANSWESLVDTIVNVYKVGEQIMVTIVWKDGSETNELVEDTNKCCPQAMLQFYQQRIKFPGQSG